MTPAIALIPPLRTIAIGLTTALVLMLTPLPVLAAVMIFKWL